MAKRNLLWTAVVLDEDCRPIANPELSLRIQAAEGATPDVLKFELKCLFADALRSDEFVNAMVVALLS